MERPSRDVTTPVPTTRLPGTKRSVAEKSNFQKLSPRLSASVYASMVFLPARPRKRWLAGVELDEASTRALFNTMNPRTLPSWGGMESELAKDVRTPPRSFAALRSMFTPWPIASVWPLDPTTVNWTEMDAPLQPP